MKTNARSLYHPRWMIVPVSLLLAGVVSVATTVTADAEDKYVHRVLVYHHTDVFVTDEYVDSMFAGASALLETNAHACSDEVACPVELRRMGDLGTFGSQGDGYDVITSDEELDYIFDHESGNFKVVWKAMNCCGTAGEIMGCAKVGTHNTVIVLEAKPEHWAHEFGHNQGLDPNPPCTCESDIMCSAPTNDGSVNASECTAYEADATKLTLCTGGSWGRIKVCYSSGSTLTTSSSWPGPYSYEGVKGWMGGASLRCADFDSSAWSYEVYRSDGDTLNYLPIGDVWKSPSAPEDWAATFFDSTALPGQTYYYRVASMDSVMRQYVKAAVGMIVGIGEVPLHSAPVSVAVKGNYAYVLEKWRSWRVNNDGYNNPNKFPQGGWLEVVDASVPETPLVVATISLSDIGLWDAEGYGPEYLTVSGERLYVAAGTPGLAIFDITHPTVPVLKSVVDIPGVHVHVCFPYAYYSTPENGLLTFDVSDASVPVQMARYNCSRGDSIRSPQWCFVHGNRAYVRCQTCCDSLLYDSGGYSEGGQLGELNIVDVTDPSSPQFASLRVPAWKVQDAKGHLLYASSEFLPEKRAVLDASNPDSVGVRELFQGRASYPFPLSSGVTSSVFERGNFVFSAGNGPYPTVSFPRSGGGTVEVAEWPWGGVSIQDLAVQDTIPWYAPFRAAFADTGYETPSAEVPRSLYRVTSIVEGGEYIYALYRSSTCLYDPGGAWLRIYRDTASPQAVAEHITFLTNPPGGKVLVDGDTLSTGTSGATISKAAYQELTVDVPAKQYINGQRYCFSSWSDGRSQQHCASCLGDTFLVASLTTGQPPTHISTGSSLSGHLDVCGSPYLIEGTAVVNAGQHLIVDEGAQLEFSSNGSLTVSGALDATGASFTSSSTSPQPGDWRGLVFAEGGSGTLTECSVQYAEKGVELAAEGVCVLDPLHSSVDLEDCTFGQCSDAGVYAGSNSSVDATGCTFLYNGIGLEYAGITGALSIQDCTFRYHDLAAISVSACTVANAVTLTLENNEIKDRADRHDEGWQGVGVRLYGDVDGQFTGNTIQGFYDGVVLVTETGPYGEALVPGPSPFTGNTISGNSHYNLKAPSAPSYQNICGSKKIIAENNNWGANTYSGIEQTIWHCTDNHGLYFIDFSPWTNPPGCPYVYSWDGERYVEENTVLGASGYSGGRSKATDYLKLSGVKVDGGKVKLEVREFEQEQSSLDAFSLLTVDYPSSLSMYLSPEGEPRLYGGVVLPKSAVSGGGTDKLSSLLYADGVVYEGEVGDCLTVDLDSNEKLAVNASSSSGSGSLGDVVDLLMLMGGKPVPCEEDCDPEASGGVQVLADAQSQGSSLATAAGSAAGQGPQGRGGILIQVPTQVLGREVWKSVARVVPREKMGEIVVPGEVLGTTCPSRLRLLWDGKHSVDRVALIKRVSGTAGSDAKVSEWSLESAQHSARGDATRCLSRDDLTVTELGGNETIALSFALGSDVPAGMTRSYVLKSVGSYRSIASSVTGSETLQAYSLKVVSANPFNPLVEIEYGLPRSGDVLLRVYSLAGRVVCTLADGAQPAGTHTVTWDGTDSGGRRVSSGVYFIKLETREYSETKKMVLLE